MARKPLVASATFVPETVRTMPEPQRCIQRLSGEKCAILSVWRLPMTTSARPCEDGGDEARDVGARYWLSASVLTMMSAPSAERRLDACHERRRQAAVPGEAHDVVNPELGRLRAGAVGAAVVDDEHFDGVDPLDAPREVREGRTQVVALVQAGDLNDELHGRRTVTIAPSSRRCPRLCRRLVGAQVGHVRKGRSGAACRALSWEDRVRLRGSALDGRTLR